ncbi:riboflavin kinase/FMN adenylyltransferase [Elusimicrobium simillimum]|uniref:riboflavin biosynthesis protein RibF n=1 Tax=Elusimicrobium simillimum TaxID=3143438 RepID=UPI003C6F642E
MKKNFITIGTFDGVHKGHGMLFARLKTLAKKHKMNSMVLYFPLPPKTLMSPVPELTVLTLPDEKLALIKQAKPDYADALNFKACKNISRENYFDILLKTYNMGGLLVGRDFAFGKDRKGHIDFLRKACAKAGIVLEVEDFFKTAKTDGHKISSSLIRKTLAEGDVKTANKYLGRPYSVSGIVVKGKQLGRQLGYPTANLDIGIYKILPLGVFAVEAVIGKEKFKAMANIGYRPTVNPIHSNVPLVEVNILNFNRDIYGKTLTINFVSKIRGEKKFNGLPALIKQLGTDARAAAKAVKI